MKGMEDHKWWCKRIQDPLILTCKWVIGLWSGVTRSGVIGGRESGIISCEKLRINVVVLKTLAHLKKGIPCYSQCQ